MRLPGRDEFAQTHRLHQARLAHERLVQQVAHHFEKDAGALRIEARVTRPRIAVAAEQHAAQVGEGLVVELGQGADFLQRIEQLELAALAELAEQRLRGAPAHRAEGVETARRIAAERLFEQALGFSGR